MTNRVNQIRNIRAGQLRSVLIFCLFLFLAGCHDGEEKNTNGLSVANLCFSMDGGDVSNTLIATADWSIEIPGNDPWLSITPKSGLASAKPINLVLNALVNNNSQSRSQILLIHIGSTTIRYIATQNGENDQVCSD